MGKHGQGSGGRTVWFDLKGRDGTLVTWNRETQQEEVFSYVFGTVEDVRVKERNYGEQVGYTVNITLRDRESGERYIIASGAGSRVTCRLLGQLNAADLSRPLYLAPYFMEKGQTLSNGETVKEDTVMTALKYVQGINGDRLELSEGIKAYYNETYGETMPAPVPILRPDGKPLIQGGMEVKDRSKLEELTAELVQTLTAKLKGDTQGQGDGQGENGIDPESVAAAAAAADRSAMRARG
jgi:hypothetical protein